ncbi:MAG TPA: M1 family metallopeptidase [Kofleriaceae bacterium]|nr:M1 family metallopeptidase [Kofleriaceae bacterium]
MQRCLVALVASLVACGPPKPSVTVPAPVGTGATEGTAEPKPTKQGDALAPPQPTLRLPRNFLPTSYAARLVIDPKRDDFDGSIQIAGEVSERSSVIWLHGRKLTIRKAVAQQAGVEVALAVTPKGEDFLEIRAQKPLDPGAWTLAIDYKGELDKLNTAGAFKQIVADQSYVFTQLEALYARRIFPCFDEPDNKVPWKLTLDVPKPLVAVSNTPQTGESQVSDTMKRVEFAQTKPLPSYLVAFGVGPFEIVDAGKTKRGTPVRVITLAKRRAEGAWAAKTSPRLLELLEDWFGSPYPYEKLDLMSIPLTVGFGAMENAGLITFTERLILIDPVKASKEREHRYVVVAAHEIAHQWFGDLVTMKYWDDIWLNEGFANWVESKASAKIDPTYRDDQAELTMRNDALNADAIVSARQIRQPIESTDDILTAFDGITYDKGASVLAMFESYLGADVFQKGVRDHLAKHAYGNATSTDFAQSISQASGKDVDAAFASFLEQAGAPEITATLSCQGGKASVALAQKRYVPPGSPTPPAGKPWIVPVCVVYDKGGGARGEACTLLSAETGTLELPASKTKACPRWMHPNVNGRGYYRSPYTTAQVTALRDEAWPKLSWTERRTLYFDVTDLATSGKLPLATALSFVPKLLAGNDRFTVPPALDFSIWIRDFVPDELLPKYEAWVRTTFGPGARKAGFTPRAKDTLDVEITRLELLHAVAWIGRDPMLVDEAVKLSDKWRDLPQSIRELVLHIAVDAKPEFFEKIRKDVYTEPDRTRRGEMFSALASVRDVERQKQALALVLDPKLDIRETLDIFGNSTTRMNHTVAQQFFREHHEEVMKRVPTDDTAGPLAGLAYIYTWSCAADQRDAIADYVTKTFGKLPGGPRVVKQAIERMDQCIARRKLLEPELRAWLGGIKLPKPTGNAAPQAVNKP